MSLAVLERVTLGFGKKTILQELNLRIAADDRIGLIGPNGSGKTSLLRLLAGEQQPDGGTITLGGGVRVGYLPQDLDVIGDKPLLRFVTESVGGRRELDEQIARCEEDLRVAEGGVGDGSELMVVAEKLGVLHERAAHHDMHYTEHEALRILRGLGFAPEERDRPLPELSGGWKMRAMLAALLFQKPDLLLLDEPTNHLDVPSVTWLADFLASYPRAFVLICHDREFLNEQVRRIVSFEVEGVRQYASDYEGYLRLREEEEVILENKAKNIARVRADAERFIDRFRAQANKARVVQSRIKALDRMEEVETFQRRKVMRIKFPAAARSGSEPIRLEGVGKRFGEHAVLDGVSLKVERGERIAIIGVNGAGKTTLLRMIAGELEPSVGKVVIGSDVRVGHYAQYHAETLNEEATVYQEASGFAPTTSVTRIRSVLGAFLFEGDDVDKKIGVLSGGERARVALARLLLDPGNLLLMDEPTNHLDLASAEALAESLAVYDGTLVLVSHNRSFVRRLATRIWNVADGTVETYPGTLDEYMDTCRRRQQAVDQGSASPAVPAPRAAPVRAAKPAPENRAAKAKSSDTRLDRERQKAGERRAKKLDQEIATLEARIATLEAAQKERSALLADPEVYADRQRSGPLLAEFREAEAEVERLTTRWEQAHGERERALAPETTSEPRSPQPAPAAPVPSDSPERRPLERVPGKPFVVRRA